MVKPIEELETILEYKFKSPDLLKTALTHSSTGQKQNYERLEFLGDRVLGLVIASLLFQKFPDEKEGDLAKRLASLVQGRTIANLSARLSLANFILLSDSEAAAGGASNDHILADVFEAVIGAMYLDGGFDPCQKLIENHWADVLYTMKKPPQHPKTEIQEWAQGQSLPLPLYEILEQIGPDHAPIFKVSLTVQGYAPVIGEGRSRAESEKSAAKIFIKKHIKS